ncbi:MAG: hypothetical protein ACOYLH_04515 [Flavobacteriales bacterium]
MTILTEYPSWFILICVVAAAAYSGALYFRDKFNRTYGTKLASVLGVLRFIAVFFLSIFVLKPLIKTISHDVEKPVIVIAQDNSESLKINKDSAFYKGEYLNQLRQLQSALGEDYDVRGYQFGSAVKEGLDSISFNEKQTDFSGLLEELNTRYSGRNLGAIVIGSDGLYNKGSNPVYAYEKLKAPVYTIALGDTTVHRDVLIAEVAANRLAYLNNRFPISITVEGRKAAGETVQVTVTHKGNVVHSENVTFTGARSFKTFEITQEAKAVGLQKYTISVSRVGNEITYSNNSRDVFIDVLDSRQRVLILASAPHPDINALATSISENEGYSVESKLINDFNGSYSEYNLIILHQLPSVGGQGLSQVRNILESKIPTLFVWGANTDFRAFNELKLGFALNDYRNANTEINGALMEGFSSFQLQPQAAELVRNAPPLSVPFGDLATSPGINTLVRQQIGQIASQKPLIAFNTVNDVKTGLITGEGIWRWRITGFRQFETHDYFNEITTKMVQFLAAKEDKSLFRVNGAKDFAENTAIVFDAELYNASYEAITDKDISMVIRNEEGQEYSYNFSPGQGRYKLNAGSLPVGNYSYKASVLNEGQTLTETGEFSVSALQLELTNTIADHRLMSQLAKENNGEMVYPNEIQKLVEMIKSRKDIVSVSYENKQLDDLINFRWILAIILFLLSLEWLLRKRAGTY